MSTPKSHILFLVVLLFPCVAAGKAIPQPSMASASLAGREHQLWSAPFHDAEFAALPQAVIHSSCEATQLPQALATPDPLLDAPNRDAKIEVSFIVGTDGRVHSPLILESAGISEDRTVLNAVRTWRYRPALCNGVPTEAEAKVEFSNR